MLHNDNTYTSLGYIGDGFLSLVHHGGLRDGDGNGGGIRSGNEDPLLNRFLGNMETDQASLEAAP